MRPPSGAATCWASGCLPFPGHTLTDSLVERSKPTIAHAHGARQALITIAVAIIISPLFTISPHILERGANSIAARIALEFGDAASSPLHLSALMGAGLVLFLVTLGVNSIAAAVVSRSRSGSGVEI